MAYIFLDFHVSREIIFMFSVWVFVEMVLHIGISQTFDFNILVKFEFLPRVELCYIYILKNFTLLSNKFY